MYSKLSYDRIGQLSPQESRDQAQFVGRSSDKMAQGRVVATMRSMLTLLLFALAQHGFLAEAYGTTGGGRNDGKTDLSLSGAESLSTSFILTFCATVLVVLVVLG